MPFKTKTMPIAIRNFLVQGFLCCIYLNDSTVYWMWQLRIFLIFHFSVLVLFNLDCYGAGNLLVKWGMSKMVRDSFFFQEFTSFGGLHFGVCILRYLTTAFQKQRSQAAPAEWNWSWTLSTSGIQAKIWVNKSYRHVWMRALKRYLLFKRPKQEKGVRNIKVISVVGSVAHYLRNGPTEKHLKAQENENGYQIGSHVFVQIHNKNSAHTKII